MKKKYIRISVLLSKESESDLIDHLRKQDNKSAYIKKLIRSDMEQ